VYTLFCFSKVDCIVCVMLVYRLRTIIKCPFQGGTSALSLLFILVVEVLPLI